MVPRSISLLLKLPAAERAALAMALWDSLTDRERDAAFDLTPETGDGVGSALGGVPRGTCLGDGLE